MRRMLTTLLVLVAAGLFATAAGAKEIEQAIACGSSGCRTLTPDQLEFLAPLEPAAEVGRAATGGAYYTLELVAGEGEGDRWTLAYLPEAGLVQTMPRPRERITTWKLTASSQSAFERVFARLAPFRSSGALVARPAPKSDSFPVWSVLIGTLGTVALLGAFAAYGLRARRDELVALSH